MEGEIELGQIVDLNESVASFNKLENENIVPESQANESNSKDFLKIKLPYQIHNFEYFDYL